MNIKNSYTKFRERLTDKVFLLQLFATVFCIDVIAFLSLGQVNPLQLLNPVKFIFSSPIDNRNKLTLYFPKAGRYVSGTAKNKHEVTKSSSKKKDKVANIHRFNLEQIVGSLDQPVLLIKDIDSIAGIEKKNIAKGNEQKNIIAENAKTILNELILGPSSSMRYSRFIRHRDLFTQIWYKESTLYVTINSKIWHSYTAIEKAVIKYCVSKSLKGNLKNIQNLKWEFS